MKKFTVLFIWFICFMTIWTFVSNLLSVPNTFVNILGSMIGLGFIMISYYTKCFTKFIKK